MRPSVSHKNITWAITSEVVTVLALIFDMHDPCDKSFQMAPCCDLDLLFSLFIQCMTKMSLPIECMFINVTSFLSFLLGSRNIDDI